MPDEKKNEKLLQAVDPSKRELMKRLLAGKAAVFMTPTNAESS